MKRKSHNQQGLRMTPLVSLLNGCMEVTTYGKLYMDSRICYKMSYNKYLKYCVDQKLIIKNILRTSKTGRNMKTEYVITPRGRMLIDILNPELEKTELSVVA
jgi:hypothetical protein